MGLEQRVEPSFGDQSDRLLPHPVPSGTGLPWFVEGLAGVLAFAGAHVMLPEGAFAQPLPQSAGQSISLNPSGEISEVSTILDPLTLELSSKISALRLAASQLGIEDLTGELVTTAYVDPITGDRIIGLRNMVFKVGMDGELKLIPDQLDKINLQDPRLSMADPIPPRSQDPIIVDPAVKEYVANLGKVLGIKSPQVTGVLNTPSYTVVRLNNDLIFLIPSEGPNAGKFILGNAGWQAILTGGMGIPETALLSPEQTGRGGGIPAPVETLTRLFLPEYKITWPDGKSFTVINPEKGRKGWVLNPNKVVQLPIRDPNTFIPVRDTEGNLIMRSSTVKDELKTAMDTHKVPKIVFVPSKSIGLERPQRSYDQYLYSEVIAKPDAFLDALVYVYDFDEAAPDLIPQRYEDLFVLLGASLGRGIYEFTSAPANTIIRLKTGTPTDLSVMMYTLEITKPVEHVYQ